MSLKDLLLIKKITHSVISITATFVALLGGWIVFSEMVTPPRSIQEHIMSRKAPGSSMASSAARTPSSIPLQKGQAVQRLIPEVKVETFEIECPRGAKAPLAFMSRARQVRLKTKSCPLKIQAGESSVVNRASGYSGTLFELERGGFTSEYMPIDDGENTITLSTRSESGELVTTEIIVTRVD